MTLTTRIVWLDLARGLSALAVCAGHLRLVMMAAYTDVPHPEPWQSLLYLVTGLSSQAVMVFFVISGMMVGGSVLRAGESFQFRDYLTSRLTRLWIVLIPGLVFTLAVDAITLLIAPQMAQGAFFRRWTSGPPLDGTYSLSPITFLGNLCFLNSVLVPSYGSNGPLWTLACEFWYYMLFPLLARGFGIIGPRKDLTKRFACLIIAVGVMALLPLWMLGGFIVWLMGVLVAALLPRFSRPASWFLLILGLITFCMGLLYSKLDHFGYREVVPQKYVVGLGFAILALSLARWPAPHRWLTAFSIGLAEISYTLYLVHFPIVVLIGVAVYGQHELPARFADWLALGGWFLLLVLAGAMLWWPFERNTVRLRRWLR